MNTGNTNHLCPICGFTLGFQAWNGNSPSDEICPCCGIQFGYYDLASTPEERTRIHEQWRKRWVELGMPWDSGRTKPPEGWNPVEQLFKIGIAV